ncbi:response regulator, partial [Clostridium perfringens]
MKNEKILLVDDEQGILEIIEILLQKEGYHRIKIAMTGQEALRSVQTESHDLIVLDVMLPDMDGFQLCGQIRQYTQVPILFVTARSGDLDKLTG